MLYFLYPQLRKLSGAERLILRLAAHTARIGEPVTLLTHYFSSSCRPELDPQVRVIETGRRADWFHNHYLDSPIEYLYSIRLLNLVGRDAKAAVFFGPPSLPALTWSRRVFPRDLPRLYFCYEPPRFAYDDSREVAERTGAIGVLARPFFSLYRLLDRAMIGGADELLANGEFGAERLLAAYRRPATIITHGADLVPASSSDVQALRARYGLRGHCVLLTVNFLHPRKRIDLFLRAFQRIRIQAPGAVALIVGEGPEKERLEGLARELQIEESVVFTGFVPDPELPCYYGLSTLYVHTGKRESFGLSVLEASAAGIPVVSVDEGGPREIIVDGVTGLLAAAEPEAIAHQAVVLLKDPARRAAMGEAARRRAADKYSWDEGARTLVKVIQVARSRKRDSDR